MRFNSNQFQWQPETKSYVAEASELGLPVGVLDPVLVIDGNEFQYYGTDHDASGEDVAGWRFKPTMGTVQKNPAMAYTKVLIIND